ncbi:MAG: Serine-type D-Ala-D-Ala carboxypeptidase [Candidatus Magasanikbacteria bacterium GW2011_GWA2_46_17]|uniref:Serine-type D-Ala-D-Ala carboxypeptidase n=2 Tax=Parcubacteria group TaxID=1794811 RepID=A0A0G1RB10_9BACT|nr:MAG: Serine-type D-Ala-D-Ala carboxypeptidase [Candidatus Magasanikbacteria bacterium GW2011_GWA2_46_17]OGG60977.1 MAG: hypothetical protein A3C86_04480 [Candidatus Kaiserbacteria bacterium RIFCSPHIGHO2_02_FULL_49_16]
MTDESMTIQPALEHAQADEKGTVVSTGHGLIPVMSFLMLFFVAVAVIMEHEYQPPVGTTGSQVAAAAAEENPFEELSLVSKAAIVIDLKKNKVLFAKNQDVQLPLASLAKIAMVLAVSDSLSTSTMLTIPRDTAPEGNAERLAKGERWRVQDIIDFTLLSSSNEGAEILANAAETAIRLKYPDAAEDASTVWRMNALARELLLQQTFFLNASGLDISPTLSGAYGSARDVAALFAYAASKHLSVFSKTANDGIVLTSANGRSTARAFNTNEAYGEIPGLIMGKTGLTDLAGGNLAIVFDADLGHPVVVVVLGSTRDGRFSDMRQLVSKTREMISGQSGSNPN